MRSLITIAVLLLSTSLAMAECEYAFDGKSGPVFKCPLPPAPVNTRVKCWMVDGARLCNSGEVGQKIEREHDDVIKPDNCRYDRRGKYGCW